MIRRSLLTLALVSSSLLIPGDPAGAAVLPSGFTDTLVAAVGGPTALAFTPDGRMLVTALEEHWNEKSR